MDVLIWLADRLLGPSLDRLAQRLANEIDRLIDCLVEHFRDGVPATA